MKVRSALVSLCVLLIFLASCNLPAGSSGQPDLAATITAQAVAIQNAVGSPTSPPLPVTGSTATPAGTQVSVSSVTNCRTGPSQAYDLVFTANPGSSFQVVGKNTPSGYWIIANPAGGSCWLWGQYAVVTGDTNGLPEYPAPQAPPKDTKQPKPTKTPAPTAATTQTSGGGTFKPPVFGLTLIVPILPSAPGNLAQTRSCAGTLKGFTPQWAEDVYLTWQASAGQSGYRVYKNGAAISEIPAGATQFHIQLRYDQGTGGALFDNFGVEAYNNAGASQRPAIDVPRCP